MSIMYCGPCLISSYCLANPWILCKFLSQLELVSDTQGLNSPCKKCPKSRKKKMERKEREGEKRERGRRKKRKEWRKKRRRKEGEQILHIHVAQVNDGSVMRLKIYTSLLKICYIMWIYAILFGSYYKKNMLEITVRYKKGIIHNYLM